MAQLRDVKDRIESVKKTRKMTQAMKMVAASKFKRASHRVLSFRPYLEELEVLFDLSLSSADQSDVLISGNDSTVEAVLLIAGDKGLCGGFNANILKFVQTYLKGCSHSIELYIIGHKGYQFFKSSSFKIAKVVEKNVDQISLDESKDLIEELTHRFKSGELGKVSLLYNEFKSAVSTRQVSKQLLPFVSESSSDVSNESYILEPDIESLFSTLSVDHLSLNLFKGLLESVAAEQGARMAAMDAATDNAGDMIKGLTLEYNRQRQSQITTELSEIVAGAEALVS